MLFGSHVEEAKGRRFSGGEEEKTGISSERGSYRVVVTSPASSSSLEYSLGVSLRCAEGESSLVW